MYNVVSQKLAMDKIFTNFTSIVTVNVFYLLTQRFINFFTIFEKEYTIQGTVSQATNSLTATLLLL